MITLTNANPNTDAPICRSEGVNATSQRLDGFLWTLPKPKPSFVLLVSIQMSNFHMVFSAHRNVFLVILLAPLTGLSG